MTRTQQIALAVTTLVLLGGGVLAAGRAGSAERAGLPKSEPPTTPGAAALPGAAGAVFDGFCEASAVVPWSGGYLVGDNETEGALYPFSGALAPLPALALSAQVEDIEAVTLLPDGSLLVVGSQGANKNGKRKPLRERVVVQGHPAVTPDLSGCAVCVSARDRPPKEGGLSIEGAASWAGELWLGVRSPVVGGEALLLKMEGDPRAALAVKETVPVDLGGRGVRDLLVHDGALIVLAGPSGGGDGEHVLYRIPAPGSAPERLAGVLPAGAEGIARQPDGALLVVTDGDGKPGEPCVAPSRWARVPFTP